MKQAPNIYSLRSLLSAADGTVQTELSCGRWVPARPLGFYSIRHRIKAAWIVFTGKGDVVVWPSKEAERG